MKKTKQLNCLWIVLCSLTWGIHAQNTLTVDNSANVVPTAYATLQEAHDAANAGDILMVHGSNSSYGNLDCTKPLTIVGPGYFLGENNATQVALLAAEIGRIDLQTGSDGTIITGLDLSAVDVFASNITIAKNKDASIYIHSTPDPITNILITQNYGGQVTIYSTTATNIIVKNNYIYNVSGSSSISSAYVFNNVFYGAVNAGTPANSFISNNIFRFGMVVSHNSIYNNNIIGGDIDLSNSTATGSNNIDNVDMATVFVGATDNSTDGQWQLAPNSPAIGAGENGIDCGMFGGADPYVLSGIPYVPSIYQLTVPLTVPASNNGLPVNVKVRSNQ